MRKIINRLENNVWYRLDDRNWYLFKGHVEIHVRHYDCYARAYRIYVNGKIKRWADDSIMKFGYLATAKTAAEKIRVGKSSQQLVGDKK